MWASRPATRSAHASTHLIQTDLDTAPSGLFLLCRRDPTDPLVSRQRGDAGPEIFRSEVSFDGAAQVCRQSVHHSSRCCLLRRCLLRRCLLCRHGSVHRQCASADHDFVTRTRELTGTAVSRTLRTGNSRPLTPIGTSQAIRNARYSPVLHRLLTQRRRHDMSRRFA